MDCKIELSPLYNFTCLGFIEVKGRQLSGYLNCKIKSLQTKTFLYFSSMQTTTPFNMSHSRGRKIYASFKLKITTCSHSFYHFSCEIFYDSPVKIVSLTNIPKFRKHFLFLTIQSIRVFSQLDLLHQIRADDQDHAKTSTKFLLTPLPHFHLSSMFS